MKATRTIFSERFFSHLDENEKTIIRERIKRNQSLCFVFYEDVTEKFCVVIDLDKESVHVRHIGGPFAWRWQYIENLCVIIAKAIKVKYITVMAQENFMIYAAKKLGFQDMGNDLYRKAIQ